MTRKKIAVLLTAITLSGATCFAAADPVAAGFTYASDSDGITTHSYKLSTAAEGKPFSFDLYRTRIKRVYGTERNNLCGESPAASVRQRVTNLVGRLYHEQAQPFRSGCTHVQFPE